MKYTLITLVALLLIIGGIAIYKGNQVNDLRADLKHLNNINDIEVEIKVEDIRKHLTDSIDKAYESFEKLSTQAKQLGIVLGIDPNCICKAKA
jgi:hypothetical protein